MKHLSLDQLTEVIAGLRSRADHYVRMQTIIPGQYDFYKKEYDKTAEIISYFEEARDRLFESDAFSIRLSVKL